MTEHPPYPAGLRLAGRRVVVVGGGSVAQRRVPVLIGAGADLVVVSPRITAALEGMLTEFCWLDRNFEESDLDGAWYAVAATDDAEVNRAVVQAADDRRIFCVRSDEATTASAWTPASGRYDGLTIAVLGNREPRRTAALRDDILEALADGRLSSHPEDRAPKVTLVGGGPGDPELITVAARHALVTADVVIADRLAPREVLDTLPHQVQLIDVAKLPRGRSARQEQINELIIDNALAGKRVVRFKGGDSFVFGRGFEEVLACREAGIPVEVIPGLSSPIAVPGIAGIPVTHRGVSHEFVVASGHLPPGHPESLVDWSALGRLSGTVVVMMGVDHAPQIAAALIAGGRGEETPVAVVCDGTMPTQRTVLCELGRLGETMAAQRIRPPAIIVIGRVVAVAFPERFG